MGIPATLNISAAKLKDTGHSMQPETTSGERHTYTRVHKSYFRATRWSRMARLGFWVVVTAFVLWTVPIFPWGMSPDDYSPAVILSFVLLGFCPAIVAIALLTGSIAAQRREVLIAWGAINDRASGLRNREFFIERLKLQCHLGRDLKEYRVGLILLTIEELRQEGQKPQAADDVTFRRIGTHVVSKMRPSDLVAAISSTEIAVLVPVSSASALQAVAVRLERALHYELALEDVPRITVRMGFASLDSTEPEPEALIEAARRSQKPVYSSKAESSAA